jgi:hypothetical protein
MKTLPGKYRFHGPTLKGVDPNIIAYGHVFVTKKHIKDEEVFLNYRFNPQQKHPDWYHEHESEEVQRRWAPVSFWDYIRLL